MKTTSLKWTRDIGWPTRYVATTPDGSVYTVGQRPGSGRFAVTTYSARVRRPGAVEQTLDGSPFGRLRDAKAACVRHATP